MSSTLSSSRARRLPAAASAALLLPGCTPRGAPSFEIFGAYFPLWLVGGVLGLVGALLAHRLFVSTGLAQVMPSQLTVCVAIGIAIAALVWLIGTGQLL